MSKKRITIISGALIFNLTLAIVLILLKVSTFASWSRISLIASVTIIGFLSLLLIDNNNEEIDHKNDWIEEQLYIKTNDKTDKTIDYTRSIVDYVSFFSVVVSIILLILNFVVLKARINGNSMDPTILEKQVVYVYQFLYTPKLDDVVIYKHQEALIIKRVVALEGDVLSIVITNDSDGRECKVLGINGEIYVNKYDEYYEFRNSDLLYKLILDKNEIVISKGQIILLGDNTLKSRDSRHDGIYQVERLVGKVMGDF
ncbi:MAG: signal peptidase I [Acholeplasma sp.]|nr:signal peptidase I [Acholeplasma sp.]